MLFLSSHSGTIYLIISNTSVEFGTFVNHRMTGVCVIEYVFKFLVVECGSHFYSVYIRECNHLPFMPLVGGKSSENLNRKFVTF